MGSQSAPDFVTIGHFAIDRTPGGEMLGGSVLYAALAASKLGSHAAILTRGNLDGLSAELRHQLEEIAGSVDLLVQSSRESTCFTNVEVAGRRSQTLHSWAGVIDLNGLPPAWRTASILHIAPVAQEVDPRQINLLGPGYLGITPQGWMRQWEHERSGKVSPAPLRLPPDFIARTNSLVISSEEYLTGREIYEKIGRHGLSVVTRGSSGATAIDRGMTIEAPNYRQRVDDTTGAGDIFAATLFRMRATGSSTIESLRYAAAMAALSVTREGLTGIPTREDAEQLIALNR